MIHKECIIHTREGEKLRTDLRYQANGKKKPVIVFLHGFKGFKNWGPYPAICERLAANGFVSLAFNFSHNGVGDELMNFTELDRFAENTFSRELDELSDLINAISILKEIPIEENEILNDHIGLLGHSRGGSIAILETPRHSSVRAVVAWSPPAYFNRYTERQRSEWKQSGYAEILNSRTGQAMRLKSSLLDDIENNADRLNIPKAASALTRQEKGLLLIAGSEDLTVKPSESQEIYDSAIKGFASLKIIPNTGHTFGAEHPNTTIPSPMEKALEFSEIFFRQYLVEHPIPFP
jgi:dienelactone hydrolase